MNKKSSPISTSSPKLAVWSVCVCFYLHYTSCGRVHCMGKKDQFRFGTIFKRVWVHWAQYSIQVHNIIYAQRRLNVQRTLLEFKRRRHTNKANGFVGSCKRFKCVKRADFAILGKKQQFFVHLSQELHASIMMIQQHRTAGENYWRATTFLAVLNICIYFSCKAATMITGTEPSRAFKYHTNLSFTSRWVIKPEFEMCK